MRRNEPIIALTGAGISQPSGIPTFRGKDGLWNKYRPEELATPQAFNRDPRKVWQWYKWRMEMIFNAQPNAAHYALAELEQKGILTALITQNVDNLHERAGSKNIIKLHGRIDRARCTICEFATIYESPPEEVPPLCPKCENLLRPDVVWFGEPLDPVILRKGTQLAQNAGAVLVIGTSAQVYPAAAIPYEAKLISPKNLILEFNYTETALTRQADSSFIGSADKTLPAFVNYLEALIKSEKES